MKNILDDCILLIDKFIQGVISAEEFRHTYIKLWMSWRNKIKFPESIQDILNDLHSDCDVFWSDSELGEDKREEGMLNEEDLKSSAKFAKIRLFEELKKI